MKIKFNTDHNLPLNKPLKLHLITIIFMDLIMYTIFSCALLSATPLNP